MKQSVVLIILFVILSACTPGSPNSIDIQATIDASLAQTQTVMAQQEPTFTPTPEYCPTSSTDTFQELTDLYNLFVDQFELAQESYKNYRDVVVELTGIKRELTSLGVPECLEYAKETLEDTIQDLTDALTYNLGGNQSDYTAKLSEMMINYEIFSKEHDRLKKCLPNCEP